MAPWLIRWLGGELIKGVVGAVRRRRARKAAEREALGLPSRKERKQIMKASKIMKWVLGLGIVPAGWLTYIGGFAAFALGGACLLGAHTVLGVHLPCPDNALELFLAGATVIGLRRFAERFVPKPPEA